MKQMKEFIDQTPEELKIAHEELSKQIFEMKNEISTTHKLDKPHLLRKLKRDRARILTLCNQKGIKI